MQSLSDLFDALRDNDAIALAQALKRAPAGLAHARLKGEMHSLIVRAARDGQADCLRAILAAGVDPNLHAEDGPRPLHWAAGNGQTECVEMLIAAGADLDASHKGQRPIHFAFGRGCIAAFRALAQAGADLATPADDGASLAEAANSMISFHAAGAPLKIFCEEVLALCSAAELRRAVGEPAPKGRTLSL
jgi:hypothetical protein